MSSRVIFVSWRREKRILKVDDGRDTAGTAGITEGRDQRPHLVDHVQRIQRSHEGIVGYIQIRRCRRGGKQNSRHWLAMTTFIQFIDHQQRVQESHVAKAVDVSRNRAIVPLRHAR